MRRRGQLALIGVIVLASTLLALVSMRTPSPLVAYERGQLQVAQLVELARLHLASDKDPARRLCLCKLLATLSELNKTMPLRMYPTWLKDKAQSVDPVSGAFSDYVAFTIQTPAGFEVVEFSTSTLVLEVRGTYFKDYEGRRYAMAALRVRYLNTVTSPFLTAQICPGLRAEEPADLARAGACEWLVGVPVEKATPYGQGFVYWLRDEHGVWAAVAFRLGG